MRIYNDVFYVRWAIISVVSFIWPNYPSLLSVIWIGLDFIMLLYAVVTLGGFKGIAGILIIFEELAVLLWHLGLAFLFYNFGDNVKEIWFNLFNYFVTFGFLVALLIEIILAFVGFSKESEEKGKVRTEDFEFDDFTEEERDQFEMKIKSYNPDLEGQLRKAIQEVGKLAWASDLKKG